MVYINIIELRYGNKIMQNGAVITVYDLETTTLTEDWIINKHILLSQCQPVALNTDVLSKTDFVVSSFGIWTSQNGTFAFTKLHNNEFIISDTKGSTQYGQPFKYLHELQNIYYWLQRSEIQISGL